MAERNKEDARQTALKTGQIYFGDPEECHDCLVWDLGKAGAMIEVEPQIMPFGLLRLVSTGLYINQRCRVAWQRGRKIELIFTF